MKQKLNQVLVEDALWWLLTYGAETAVSGQFYCDGPQLVRKRWQRMAARNLIHQCNTDDPDYTAYSLTDYGRTFLE